MVSEIVGYLPRFKVFQGEKVKSKKEIDLPEIRIGNEFPNAEEYFIALRNSIFPQNLSREDSVFHNANGFFFKIYPVEFNANGTYSLSVERRINKNDIMPLDVIEIIRNFTDPENPASTSFSYREVITKNGIATLVSLKGIAAKSKIEIFLSTMTPLMKTENNTPDF